MRAAPSTTTAAATRRAENPGGFPADLIGGLDRLLESIHRLAQQVDEQAQALAERRQRDATELADLLIKTDEDAGRRVQNAARRSVTGDRRTTKAMLDEVLSVSQERVMRTVGRYSATLAGEVARANGSRSEAQEHLVKTLARIDRDASARMRQAIEVADRERLEAARRQSEEFSAAIQKPKPTRGQPAKKAETPEPVAPPASSAPPPPTPPNLAVLDETGSAVERSAEAPSSSRSASA
jgi:hypothetical protein